MISPHLDDAVFSAGSLIATLAEYRHEVIILTCFTASVENPGDFALACQLDKGLNAEVDYMRLRREEDVEACEILGASPIWLKLPEAPHRSYMNAKELFEEIKTEDRIQEELFLELRSIIKNHRPEYIFYPKGIGNHVDHQQVCNAVQKLKLSFPEISYLRWYDQPYLLRNPSAMVERPEEFIWKGLDDFEHIVSNDRSTTFSVKTGMPNKKKTEACKAYKTQVKFQFGSYESLESVLTGDSNSPDFMSEFFSR